MHKIIIFLVFLSSCQALSPSTFVSKADKDRFKELFQAILSSQDGNSVSYAVLGMNILGEKIANTGDVCKKLQASIDGKNVNGETLYLATSAAKVLGSCVLKPNAQASQLLKSEGSVQELHNGVLSQVNLGQKVTGSSVIKTLTDALKKDDSISSLALAFNLASQLGKSEATAIFDRVEDAIVQADEINGKILQFEGGLTVSSQVINGVYSLAKLVGKAPTVSKLQAVKFANYFLSRKNVQAAKGAWSVLSALQTLSSNDFHIPVTMSLVGSPSVSEQSPKVQIQVTDVMGNDLGPMAVQVDSAMRQSDGAVVLSKHKMTDLGNSKYEVDLMGAKPGKGFYELTVTSTPSKANAKLAGNEGAVLLVKVLCTVALDNVEIGIADADQSTAAKMTSIAHPNKAPKVLNADHHHKLIMKFAVKDKSSGDKIKVHQAFVRLALEGSNAEIIYVAEPDSSNQYKFDLDVSAKAKEFGGKSGKYSISLIIGDFVISNPINWNLADIKLEFPAAGSEEAAAKTESPNKAKPEIRHLFREPEKRPPTIVSTAFTGLCLVPFAFMLMAWMKLGVNMSSFPISLSALGFHLGLGAIFALYYLFWLQWDMFTTFKYLIMIGVVTFLCGNSMLVKIAERRKKAA